MDRRNTSRLIERKPDPIGNASKVGPPCSDALNRGRDSGHRRPDVRRRKDSHRGGLEGPQAVEAQKNPGAKQRGVRLSSVQALERPGRWKHLGRLDDPES